MQDVKKRLRGFSGAVKIIILTVLFALLIMLIFAGRRPYKGELHEGDISLVDIYAPYDFTYPGDIDEARTEAFKTKMLQGFLPVYDVKTDYWDEKRRALSEFFTQLKSVRRLKDVDDNARVEKLKQETGVDIDNRLLFPFLYEDMTPLASAGVDAARRIAQGSHLLLE